jgi:hypothetical protein
VLSHPKHGNSTGTSKRLNHRLLRLFKYSTNVLKILTHSSSETAYIGWLGHRNLGDEVLFQTISSLLSRARIFPYAPTPFEIRLLRRIAPNKKFRAVCLGGGTLIGGEGYLRIVEDALSRDIPLFSFGTGVLDPNFWEESGRLLTEWTKALSQFREVSVRGFLSEALLKEARFENVTVVGDPVLALAGDNLIETAEDMVLGVNVGFALPNECWGGGGGSLINDIAQNLKLLSSMGWRFRLFGVAPKDEYLLHRVAKTIDPALVKSLRLYADPYAFMSDAAKCSVFVGMKLHATILAYAAFTPIIMLEYDPKCKDFMFTVDRMGFNVRTDRIRSGEIADLVIRCRRCRADLRRDQLARSMEFKRKLKSFANLIQYKIKLGLDNSVL